MKRRTRVRLVNLCKIGTIAHNRPFSRRDFVEYAGTGAQLNALLRRGVIKRVGRGEFYPTSKGWDIVERACKMRTR